MMNEGEVHPLLESDAAFVAVQGAKPLKGLAESFTVNQCLIVLPVRELNDL